MEMTGVCLKRYNVHGMIQITDQISISESEIKYDFVHSSGPGGQNVNKVSTAVQLRFDTRSPSLPLDVQNRLQKLARKRINDDGELVISANRFRSQEKNRLDALERLQKLILRATQPPKIRRPTRPTRASRERRLQQKKQRSEIKKQRGSISYTGK